MKNDRRQRGQLQSPYGLLTLAPLAKRQSIQVNINSASELIRPSGLSKQWGPPHSESSDHDKIDFLNLLFLHADPTPSWLYWDKYLFALNGLI